MKGEGEGKKGKGGGEMKGKSEKGRQREEFCAVVILTLNECHHLPMTSISLGRGILSPHP